MKQVTKDEFFAAIRARELDVHPTIVTSKYPYTSDWTFHRQGGRLYGRSVGRMEGGCEVTDYFISD